MATRLRSVWLASLLAVGGCLSDKEEPLQTIKPGEYARQVKSFHDQHPQLTPASKEESVRVLTVGQKLIQANRQTGLRPAILPVGVPATEVFHKGTDVLYLTEGLSKKCVTEGQLAAVMAYELGRMVAEREALAAPDTRQSDRLPPQETRIGMDSGGPFGAADATHLAELSKFEKEYRRPGAPPRQPPDPLVLAKIYLEAAGYTAKDLDDVGPLLKAARANDGYERQLVGGQMTRPWVP